MNDQPSALSRIVRAGLISGTLAACAGQQPASESATPGEEKHHCSATGGCGATKSDPNHHCAAHGAEFAGDAGPHAHVPE